MTEITQAPVISLDEVNFLQETKKVLNEVVLTRDFDSGFNFVNQLHDRGRMFAKGIGLLLEGMEEYWLPSEHEGETFFQAANRLTDLSPITIKRHIKIQKALENPAIPEEVRERISALPQKSLIQVAELIESDKEIKHRDWVALATAADEREVGRIARKIKKVAPRSNYLAITMDENGKLVAHTAEVHKEFGRLDVNSKDEVVQRAIARLIGCSGVLEKVEY